MAILTHYDINRFMYPLTHCNNLSKEQKEIILKHACEAREHKDSDSYFIGKVSYRTINNEVIAELKTNSYYPIEGEYELIQFNEGKYMYEPSNAVNSEYWDYFKYFRVHTLIDGFDVLRKFVDDSKMKRLREKAYYCISYYHSSAYDYEMKGYNDETPSILCRDLYKNYYYYDENFDVILEFKHFYNKGEIKIRENTVF